MKAKVKFGKPGKAAGFVRAIKSLSPDRAPAFAVELYCPTASITKRTQWFTSDKVEHNRELVFVSLLRDALIHALPVEITYDSLRFIVSVDIRTQYNYEQEKPNKIKGNITGLIVNEHGIGKSNWGIPDLATVQIDNKGTGKVLYLNLQRGNRETTSAQLSLLRQAYMDGLEVELTYQDIAVSDQYAVKHVNVTGVLPFITGLQLGEIRGDYYTAKIPGSPKPGSVAATPPGGKVKKAGVSKKT